MQNQVIQRIEQLTAMGLHGSASELNRKLKKGEFECGPGGRAAIEDPITGNLLLVDMRGANR